MSRGKKIAIVLIGLLCIGAASMGQGWQFLRLTGGTMTGNLSIEKDAAEAATFNVSNDSSDPSAQALFTVAADSASISFQVFSSGFGLPDYAVLNAQGSAGFIVQSGGDLTLRGSGTSIELNSGELQVKGGKDLFLNGGGVLHITERGSDPSEAGAGRGKIWQSNGSGKGDDGDILIAVKAGGVTRWDTIYDHSAANAW